MLRQLSVLSVLVVVGLLVSCGGDGTGKVAPACTGTSCICPAGAACDIGAGACLQQSCSIGCKDANVCSGTCGESCSAECSGGSSCAITVGQSSSVSCATGSTCHIICTSSCSLSCPAGAACDLKCATDTAPHAVTGSGSCAG